MAKPFIQEAQPSSGVELNCFWYTESTGLLYQCTATSPITFALYTGSDATAQLRKLLYPKATEFIPEYFPAPTSTQPGAVPPTGTPSGKFLKDDGTWAAPTASAAWGAITGTLGDQTDLGTALGGKAASSHTHAPTDITGTAVITTDSRLSDARALAAGADKTKLDGIATAAVADHVNIANKGTNTHAQIDTHLAAAAPHSGHEVTSAKAAASGYASLDSNSKLVQARARGDDGVVYAALANDTLAQAYATNSVTKLTVTANRTLTTTVPAAGCRASTVILTSGTSSFTITFGSGFKPTATLATGTTSSRVFVVEWISDGTNLYESSRTIAMVA